MRGEAVIGEGKIVVMSDWVAAGMVGELEWVF